MRANVPILRSHGTESYAGEVQQVKMYKVIMTTKVTTEVIQAVLNIFTAEEGMPNTTIRA